MLMHLKKKSTTNRPPFGFFMLFWLSLLKWWNSQFFWFVQLLLFQKYSTNNVTFHAARTNMERERRRKPVSNKSPVQICDPKNPNKINQMQKKNQNRANASYRLCKKTFSASAMDSIWPTNRAIFSIKSLHSTRNWTNQTNQHFHMVGTMDELCIR